MTATRRNGRAGAGRRGWPRWACAALGPRSLFFAALLVLAACGTTREVEVVRPLAAGLRAFLPSPLAGWTEPVEEPWRGELERAHAALVDESDHEVARVAAEALAGRLGEAFAPAQVLLAQVELSGGDPRAAVARLLPVVERHPQYQAAQLLLGRGAELTDDLWTAMSAYQAAAGTRVAEERLAAVRRPALERGRMELDQALARGRIDEAEVWRDRLVEAAPDEELTVDGGRAVAAARGDVAGELAALRRLGELALPGAPLDRGRLERRAELELGAGEASVAVDIYSELSRRFPGDLALEEGLAAAQFRFRLALLPDEVKGLLSTASLTRGDFATLLYWLVPGARGGRAEAATIVTDVPEEHPQRVAIVRVVNLGLLQLDDPALRRFGPDAPMLRGRAMRTLLQMAARGSAPAACVAPLLESPRPSGELVCEVAAGCGWISEVQVCLPSAPLDGPTAERFLRLALASLGG